MKKAVIYARNSPTKKKKGKEDVYIAYSIENQKNKCEKQIQADENTFIKMYYDEYVSGKAQEYMKEFKQLMDDAKLKKFDIIYCLRVDRFGRNIREMLNSEKELRDLGIYIKFVEQGFVTDDTFGRMIMNIMASIAEWQREVIITNTTIGRELAYEENPDKFGRPKAKIDWTFVNKHLELKDTEGKYGYSWSKIAKLLHISTATLLRRYRAEKGEIPKRNI
tara:strand:+ start:219 stop:881 length:663 start_codon:yes stop_codon:yes gene_type:complete